MSYGIQSNCIQVCDWEGDSYKGNGKQSDDAYSGSTQRGDAQKHK